MPLLEAMPLIWCIVFAFTLLRLALCGKFSVLIIASAAALTSAVAGIPPWIQIGLWCGITSVVHVFLALRMFENAAEADRCALVISCASNGQDGTVLYRGKRYPARPGCHLTEMPPCGYVVKVFLCEDGSCMICPQ